jgi:YHS domain-containing protein
MKKSSVVLLFCLAVSLSGLAQKSPVFAPEGKAIKGYDAVAFFTDAKPVKGVDSLSYKWQGAEWLFVSRKHLESFKSNPGKYAPQYGGYCAYGTSQGHKAPTEADTWTIVGDKLYFNYNGEVKKMWLKDQQPLIKKADQNWPEVMNQ